MIGHALMTGRRRPPLWLLQLLLLLCTAAHSVRAQMVAERMHAEPIDWGSTRVVTALVLGGLTLPLFLVGITLLVLRRKTHPIAGRGFPVLMLWACNALGCSTGGLLLHVAFPRGAPCGLHAFHLWSFAPIVGAVIARVWFLVFRIEIAEFLTELAWRQTKHARIMAHRSKREGGPHSGSTLIRVQSLASIGDFAKAPAKHSSLSSRTNAKPHAAVAGSLDLPDLSPASIPGYRFITNRRFTEPRFVAAVLGAHAAAVLLMCCLVIAFDPDVEWTNSWRRARGLPEESFSSFYTRDTITDAPRCLWYSIKMIAFVIASFPAIPAVAWTGWRLRFNALRAKRRAKEQADFEAILAGTDGAAAGSLMQPSSSRSHVQDIDELDFVKIELCSAFVVAVAGLLGNVTLTGAAYEYVGLNSFFSGVGVFAATGAQAIVLSIWIAHKQRKLMQRARQTDSAQSRRYTRGKFVAQIAHHRQLYRLQHLLHDSFAYPLLLKFLQKEYSSENALFVTECRRFAKLCKQIESQIAGWTSLLDEEDDGETRITRDGVTVLGGGGRSRLAPPASPAPAAARPQGSPTSFVELVVESSPAATPLRINGWQQQQQQERQPASPITPLQIRDSTTPRTSPSRNPLIAAAAAAGASSSAQGTPVRTPLRALVRSDSGGQHRRRDSESRSRRRAPWVVPSPTHAQASSSPPWAVAPAAAAAASESPLSAPLDLPVAQQQSLASKRQLFIHTKLAPAAVSAASPPVVQHKPQQLAPRLTFRAMHELAQKARDWALKIHADYLQSNAVYQINIDSDLSRLVASQVAQLRLWEPTPLDAEGQPDFERAAMESAPPTPPPFPLSSLYKQTALSVFNLMETDSFRRFLLTADFQLLLQRADDEEMARLQRQADVTTRHMVAAADAVLAAQSMQVATNDDVTVLPGATEHEFAH